MFISDIFFPYEVLVSLSLNPCTDCALDMHAQAHDALNLFFKIGFLHLLHLYCRFVWDNYFVEKMSIHLVATTYLPAVEPAAG